MKPTNSVKLTSFSKRFVVWIGEGIPDDLLREMACLDFCAELELEGYTGSRLDKSTFDHILQVQYNPFKLLAHLYLSSHFSFVYSAMLQELTEEFLVIFQKCRLTKFL